VARLSDPVPNQGAGQGQSLNMRASFVHLVTDAAGSLGALLAGVAIWAWGWASADTIVSMATAILVLWTGWGLLRESTHVLMEGVPRGLDPETVLDVIGGVDGVVDAHHLHLWNLASDVPPPQRTSSWPANPPCTKPNRPAPRSRPRWPNDSP
jgi:cation diffusion facilitator family transporter